MFILQICRAITVGEEYADQRDAVYDAQVPGLGLDDLHEYSVLSLTQY